MLPTLQKVPQGFQALSSGQYSPIEFSLTLDFFQRPWKDILDACGNVSQTSQLWWVHEKELPPLRAGRGKKFIVVNFCRFVSSRRALAWAVARGFRPAHPYVVLAVSQRYYNLPQMLGCPAPLSLTTLIPCYRDAGEDFVLAVEWDRKMERSTEGVYYDYGWEPEYWFLFEARA